LISDDLITDNQAMYIQRSLTNKLKYFIKYFPAIAITGARQVGKSTWLKEVLGQEAMTVVFDPIVDLGNARQDPELFLRSRKASLKPGQKFIILDEIQYVPQLIPVLKRMIDEDRAPGQYILTGSQQWEVMKSLADSLAGRVAFLDLEGFNLSEIAQEPAQTSWLDAWMRNPEEFVREGHARLALRQSVFETLWRGFLPEVQFLPTDLCSPFFAGYLRTYIERDVRQLADVNDLEIFGRFVRLCTALSGQEVNYSQLGRDLGITPQTSRRWLQILKSTFQWFEVDAFSQNSLKKISSKPKGYISDTGFLCFSQAISSPDALSGHPLLGSIFETAVAAELRKQIVLMNSPVHLYHWRSHSGAEVDFILERDGQYFPIEVKAKSNPSKRDAAGIESFRLAYPHLKISNGMVISPSQEIIPLSQRDWAISWDMRSNRP